jgi:rubrerythrin
MQTPQTRATSTADGTSPVDDVTYDLLQALTSKLEAIEAYRMYADDGSETSPLFERMAADERKHAELLLEALRERLNR